MLSAKTNMGYGYTMYVYQSKAVDGMLGGGGPCEGYPKSKEASSNPDLSRQKKRQPNASAVNVRKKMHVQGHYGER